MFENIRSVLGTCIASLTLVTCIPSFAGQVSSNQYSIGKAGHWVENIPQPTKSSPSVDSGATQTLLMDTQVNLLKNKPATYFHGRVVAHERSALESVSNLRITFNPRFEHLTIHEIAIFRNGQRLERLKAAKIDIAQRERRLDDGIYDEDVEAIIIPSDIRVGDVLDFSYTIEGENPIFNGKYSAFFPLNRDHSVKKVSVRINYPANRNLYFKQYKNEFDLIKTEKNGVKTIQLEAENLPVIHPEQAVPTWYGIYPWLQVSEFSDWGDVEYWAKNLYAIPNDLSPEIEEVITRIKATVNTPEQQAAQALKWVQNEIRYYSIAVGTSSHRPNHPNQTVKQRFGDCKDKSLLLAAILMRLGIQAEPALVSTQARQRISDFLPTPIAFDHAIVKAEINSQIYWLDGTRTYQGEALNQLGFTLFGKALPIGKSSNGHLADVSPPPNNHSGFSINEHFKASRFGEATLLKLDQEYKGQFAEWYRNQIAAQGLQRSLESQINDYARDFPNITALNQATFSDDPINNRLVISQSFHIPQLFTYETGKVRANAVYARTIIPWLRYPGTADRKFPLALPYPENFEHRITIETPFPVALTAPPPESWRDQHYALSNKISIDGNSVHFVYSVKTLKNHVSPENFPSFSEKFKQASGMFFSSLTLPSYDLSQLRKRLADDFQRQGANFRNPDQLDNFQQNFIRNHAIADEAIRGNYLGGALLARAYKDRAEAASLLGRRGDALRDIDQSLALETNDSALTLKAEILLYEGRLSEADDNLKKVKNEKEKSNFLINQGLISYYQERYADAENNFSTAAEIAGDDELPYALTWLVLSQQRQKRNFNPQEIAQKYSEQLKNTWMKTVFSYATGEISQETLLAAARSEEKERRLRLCEAYFFMGEKALIMQDLTLAKNWFLKAIETRASMYKEYNFAQQALQKLSQQ